MNVPEQWSCYPCEDYFSSPLADDGFFDESAQLWLIEPAHVYDHRAGITGPVDQSGVVGGPPIPAGQQFTYNLSTQGRLITPEEFFRHYDQGYKRTRDGGWVPSKNRGHKPTREK